MTAAAVAAPTPAAVDGPEGAGGAAVAVAAGPTLSKNARRRRAAAARRVPVPCSVCDERLTAYAFRVRRLGGCTNPAGALVCAPCAGRDLLSQLREGSMAHSMRCISRCCSVTLTHMESLVTTRHLEASAVGLWQRRRQELEVYLAVVTAQREAVRRRREEARAARALAGEGEGEEEGKDDGGEEGEGMPPLEPVVMEGRLCKPCPMCGILCDRFEGCNHVRCSVCKKEFRWCCLVPGTSCVSGCKG